MDNTGKLNVIVGNIVDDQWLRLVDAVVLPSNPMMRCGCGVSGAIFHKAGVNELEQYTERRFGISYFDETRKNEMKPTEVRITPGFALPCNIIFAQGPKIYEYDNFQTALNLLLETYRNVLRIAVANDFGAILLPALGTGSYGFEHENTAREVMELLKNFVSRNNIEVYFIVLSDDIKQQYYVSY